MAPCAVRAAHFCTTDPVAGDTRNEFQAWGGYSPHSGGPISSTTNTNFGVGGLLYSRRCWSWSTVSLSYNVGFMPAAIVHQPTLLFSYPGPTLTPVTTVITTSGNPSGGGVWVIGTITTAGDFPNGYPLLSLRRTVYGFAGTPIGFTFDAWRSARVYPFLQVDGGLIKSSQPVPYNVPEGTSGNFLLSLGGGVKIRIHKAVALSAGYKLMHISNADRTYFNPGLDNNVIFAGISLLK